MTARELYNILMTGTAFEHADRPGDTSGQTFENFERDLGYVMDMRDSQWEMRASDIAADPDPTFAIFVDYVNNARKERGPA